MFRSILCATLICATPVFADAQQDADYIVSQTVTQSVFEATINAQRDLIIAATSHNLAQEGIVLTDAERYFDILIEEFISEFTLTMQTQTATMYQEMFSDEELADIATFYKTPAGQSLIAATPAIVVKSVEMGRAAGEAAGQNVGGRIVKRLEAEGIQPFQDPSMFDKLRDMLN